MIVDASAVLAVLLREDDAPDFLDKLSAATELRMSAVNLFEVLVKSDRVGGAFEAEALLSRLAIAIEPVTAARVQIARAAHLKFGKGRHPARLNMGDCFAYALATELGEPLLFKGGDFALTDVALAG
jgi:ribonuclease VapC